MRFHNHFDKYKQTSQNYGKNWIWTKNKVSAIKIDRYLILLK